MTVWSYKDKSWVLVTLYNGKVNPRPSTDRGRRRHAARSDPVRAFVEKLWARAEREYERMLS